MGPDRIDSASFSVRVFQVISPPGISVLRISLRPSRSTTTRPSTTRAVARGTAWVVAEIVYQDSPGRERLVAITLAIFCSEKFYSFSPPWE